MDIAINDRQPNLVLKMQADRGEFMLKARVVGTFEQTWSERVYRSTAQRPLPYLELVLSSETVVPDHSATMPLLKVFRVVEPL